MGEGGASAGGRPGRRGDGWRGALAAGPVGCTEGLCLRAIGASEGSEWGRPTQEVTHFKSNTDNRFGVRGTE